MQKPQKWHVSCIVSSVLFQVDMQSIQKEKEILCAEKEEKKKELIGLQEENKALHATLAMQGPPEGDKSDSKVLKMYVFYIQNNVCTDEKSKELVKFSSTLMQILTLTNELAEVRGALRRESLYSNETNKRAEKAELELKELKVQLEKRTVTAQSQIEVFINVALIRVSVLFNQIFSKWIMV